MEKWHCEDNKGILIAISPLFIAPPLVKDETINDLSIRGTRSLSIVYQRWNLFMAKPKNFSEVAIDPK